MSTRDIGVVPDEAVLLRNVFVQGLDQGYVKHSQRSVCEL